MPLGYYLCATSFAAETWREDRPRITSGTRTHRRFLRANFAGFSSKRPKLIAGRRSGPHSIQDHRGFFLPLSTRPSCGSGYFQAGGQTIARALPLAGRLPLFSEQNTIFLARRHLPTTTRGDQAHHARARAIVCVRSAALNTGILASLPPVVWAGYYHFQPLLNMALCWRSSGQIHKHHPILPTCSLRWHPRFHHGLVQRADETSYFQDFKAARRHRFRCCRRADASSIAARHRRQVLLQPGKHRRTAMAVYAMFRPGHRCIATILRGMVISFAVFQRSGPPASTAPPCSSRLNGLKARASGVIVIPRYCRLGLWHVTDTHHAAGVQLRRRIGTNRYRWVATAASWRVLNRATLRCRRCAVLMVVLPRFSLRL